MVSCTDTSVHSTDTFLIIKATCPRNVGDAIRVYLRFVSELTSPTETQDSSVREPRTAFIILFESKHNTEVLCGLSHQYSMSSWVLMAIRQRSPSQHIISKRRSGPRVRTAAIWRHEIVRYILKSSYPTHWYVIKVDSNFCIVYGSTNLDFDWMFDFWNNCYDVKVFDAMKQFFTWCWQVVSSETHQGTLHSVEQVPRVARDTINPPVLHLYLSNALCRKHCRYNMMAQHWAMAFHYSFWNWTMWTHRRPAYDLEGILPFSTDSLYLWRENDERRRLRSRCGEGWLNIIMRLLQYKE